MTDRGWTTDWFGDDPGPAGDPGVSGPEFTPIEDRGGVLVKRDDLFAVGGVRGGKVRTCWHLSRGAVGLVTAGSRHSPQVNIVAHVARKLGIPCRIHVPSGKLSPEVVAARDAGAEVVPHLPGYNTVIVARAHADAVVRGWTEIPFGMECVEATRQTAHQVGNVARYIADNPGAVGRIVVPVGSGMSLAGILHGFCRHGVGTPVLAVRVGADPAKRLDRYAPSDWRRRVTVVETGVDYAIPAATTGLGGLTLDSVYEGKCIPFLSPGDLLWVVGIRQTEAPDAGDSA